MTFLQPSAMLLAGILLIPLLLALYLLKLRRRPLRVTTTFLWVEATRDLQVNVPLAPLRAGLLFVLHALLLLCLIAALGRPALDAPSPGTRQTIIIDASASMGARGSVQAASADPATDGNPSATRLDLAKSKAKAMLPTLLSTGAKVAVVSFASTAQLRCGFSADSAALQEAIESITQTDEPGRPERLLPILETLVIPESNSEEDLPPDATDQGRIQRIRPVQATVLTDGCNGLPRQAALLPAGLALRQVLVDQPVATPASGEPINLGITSIAAKRDERDATVLRLFIRVHSSGGIPCTLPLSVTLDGAPAQSVPPGQLPMLVQVKPAVPGGPDAQPVAQAVAEAVALVDVLAPAGGTLTASVGLRDALAVDNTASIVVPRPRTPRIVLIVPESGPSSGPKAGSGAKAVSEAPGDPIVRALLEEIVGGLTPLSPGEPSAPKPSISVLGERAFRAARAAGAIDADLLVFDGVTLVDQADAKPLLAGVSSVHFGAGLPGVRLAGPGNAEPIGFSGAQAAARSILTVADRSDPIMRGVVPEGVIVDGSGGMQRDPALQSSPGTRAKVLLESASGPQVVALDEPGGLRRVVVGFPLRRSSWATHVSFVVFVSNVVEQLSGTARLAEGVQYHAGVPLVLPVPTGAARTVRLQGPEGEPVGSAVLGPDDTTVSFPATTRAGLFRIVDPNAPPRAAPGPIGTMVDAVGTRDIAVNLCDVDESELAPLASSAEAQRWWVGGSDSGAVASRREPRELWRELLLACAGLLVLEWIVFAWQAGLRGRSQESKPPNAA